MTTPERSEDVNSPSVLEEIVNADRHTVISRFKLANELTSLAKQGNKEQLVKLLDAYCGWKARTAEEGTSVEDVRPSTLRDLDGCARLADAKKFTGNYVAADTYVAFHLPTGRKIQTFFRDAVNYHPEMPDTYAGIPLPTRQRMKTFFRKTLNSNRE